MERTGPLLLLLLLLRFGTAQGSFNGLQLKVASPSSTDAGKLVMKWQPSLTADFIAVFNTTPPTELTSDIQPLVLLDKAAFPHGYYRTNIPFIQRTYPNGWGKGFSETPMPGDTCVNYWIAAYLGNDLLQADCFKIRPTWITDQRELLAEKPLVDVFFSNDYHLLGRRWPIEKVDQHELNLNGDVWGQLVRGVRYFNLNLRSLISKDGDISGTDDSYRWTAKNEERVIRLLLRLFADIKEFFKKAKYEIMILNIEYLSETPEDCTIQLYEFALCLYSVLGDYIIPLNHLYYDSKFDEIWETGRNIIVAFNDIDIQNWFVTRWSRVLHISGGSVPSEKLQGFLQECFVNGSMSEISNFRFENMTAPIVIQKPDGVKRNVTKWFQKYSFKFENNATAYVYLGNAMLGDPVIACFDRSNNTIFLRICGDGKY